MIKNDKKQEMTGRRSHWVNLRLTPEEHDKMLAAQRKTTSKTLSAYARKLLLGKPVTVIFHDQSKDNTLEQLASLRGELGAIGNNFNQVVKRIHRIDDLPNKEFWLTNSSRLQKLLLQKVDSIQLIINKISEQWSRES